MTDHAIRSGPLASVKVLELGSTVAAPYCGRLFADFGAEVIKVEPFHGDTVRSMGCRKNGRSLYAASILRNKKLLALDLSAPKGCDVARRLAARCDVVIENFRPGKLEEWGLSYESLAADNPGLVLVRISGYGQTGPYRDRPGYGVTCEAVSGLRELTGDPDRPPSRVAVSLTDEVAALYGAFGAMMALFERERTGRGQVIDVALYEAAFSLTEPHVPAYSSLGLVGRRAGSRLPNSAPNNLYPASDGGYVHITALSDSLFRRLAGQIGRPELADDSRFVAGVDRSRNEDALDEIITKWTQSLPLDELERRLIEASIPAARIYDMPDVFRDPHFRDRNMLVELEDPDLGSVTLPGLVPKLSRTPGAIYKVGGNVGVDTRRVLDEFLNLSEAEIDTLVAAKAIYIPEEEREAAVPD